MSFSFSVFCRCWSDRTFSESFRRCLILLVSLAQFLSEHLLVTRAHRRRMPHSWGLCVRSYSASGQITHWNRQKSRKFTCKRRQIAKEMERRNAQRTTTTERNQKQGHYNSRTLFNLNKKTYTQRKQKIFSTQLYFLCESQGVDARYEGNLPRIRQGDRLSKEALLSIKEFLTEHLIMRLPNPPVSFSS